jgi:hypothetical protein
MKKTAPCIMIVLCLSGCAALPDLLDIFRSDDVHRVAARICSAPELVEAYEHDPRVRLRVAGRDAMGRLLACGLADLVLQANDPTVAAKLLERRLIPGDRVDFSLLPSIPTVDGVPTAAATIDERVLIVKSFNVERRVSYRRRQNLRNLR